MGFKIWSIASSATALSLHSTAVGGHAAALLSLYEQACLVEMQASVDESVNSCAFHSCTKYLYDVITAHVLTVSSGNPACIAAACIGADMRDTALVDLMHIRRLAVGLQTPVLIAVDDYNVLYSHTNYHEWMNEVYRRQLQPHELRVASAFKLLERQVLIPLPFFCSIKLSIS